MAYGYVAYGIRYRELIKRIRPIAIQTIIVIAMLSVLWIGLICNVLSDNAEKNKIHIKSETKMLKPVLILKLYMYMRLNTGVIALTTCLT